MGRSIRCLLAVLLLAAACSGGGGSDDAENAAPQASATAPASANERSEAALSGSGTDADGSVSAYLWSIEAPPNTNVALDSATSANARLVIGEIAAATTITVRLQVTDNDGATATASKQISLVEIDAALLPPEPDDAASMATVAGVDTDNNGVRDDVEHSIYGLYPLDTPKREVLLIGANALQMQVLVGATPNQSAGDAASERSAQFAACGAARNIEILTMVGDLAAVKLFTLNTAARQQAYVAYEESRVGTVQRALNPQTTNCTFPF